MSRRETRHPLDKRLRPPFAAADRDPCVEEGCITVPNGYNPGPRCLAHTLDETSEARRSQILDRDARREARLSARAPG